MQKTLEFIEKCNTYYLATIENDAPKVRPFGTINLFDGKLYIQTGKIKEVSKQMHINPNIEICCFTEGTWLRLSAKAIEDPRLEAKESMLDKYPNLKNMYKADDGNTEVFYLEDATATFYSFGATPEEHKF